MNKYRICSKPMKLLFSQDNEGNTLNTIRRNHYRFIVNKAACISLVLSLVSNTLPQVIPPFGESNSFSNETSDVSFDVDERYRTTINNYKDFTKVAFSDLDLLTCTSITSLNFLKEDMKTVLLDEYIESICKFIDEEDLSMNGFIKLLNSMVLESGPFGKLYPNKRSAINALISENKSYEIKFLIVMARDGYTYDELDYMCAGIVGEAPDDGYCYIDAYAVGSTLINRSHTLWYVNNYGQNFYNIFTAPGQYEIEISGNYLKFLGAIDLPGYQAAIDAFYTRESIHDYLQFRGRWVDLDCPYETFAPNGNKFIDKMKESDYVPYSDENVKFEAVKKLVLSGIKF